MQSFDINLFFEIFSTNGKLLLFVYGNFAYFSLRKLKTLPNDTGFIYLGTEYRINNNKIERV